MKFICDAIPFNLALSARLILAFVSNWRFVIYFDLSSPMLSAVAIRYKTFQKYRLQKDSH